MISMMKRRKRILFLCTGNSARSQMAEGLMKVLGSDRWSVQSAGTLSSFVHPLAIRVMAEIGIDISHHTSKSLIPHLRKKFDYVITLCDHADSVCPSFPGNGTRLHWSFDDPASAEGTEEERLAVFRHVRDGIRDRIAAFLRGDLSDSDPPDPIASFTF